MLKSLIIKNFILIDTAEIDFGKSLNIITGETGSGKSLIFKAIAFVFGDKSIKDAIKPGQNKCEVISIFKSSPTILKKLSQIGLDSIDGEDIIVKRCVTADTNKYYLNDSIISYQKLQELKELLINISSQHSQQRILRTNDQLEIIDSFIKNKDLIQKYQDQYHEYLDLQKQIKETKQSLQYKDERLNYIKKQIKEIDSMDISEDDDNLEEKIASFKLLESNIKKINQIESTIFGDDQSISSIFLTLKNMTKSFKDNKGFNEGLDHIDKAMDSFYEEIKNIKSTIDAIDPDQMQEMIIKNEKITKLIKQFGSIKNLFIKKTELEQELQSIITADKNLQKLESSVQTLLLNLMSNAKILSDERKTVAKKISKKIESELCELSIPNNQFQIELEQRDLSPTGIDVPSFLFSANKGQPLKSIKDVASGGELSRIMLAISNISVDTSPVSIFLDEIDSGISGNTGFAIGKKIKELSKSSQIICITHLPQIAVFGETFFIIDKVSDKTTSTNIIQADSQDKITQELARMVGSELSPKDAHNFALKLLEAVKD